MLLKNYYIATALLLIGVDMHAQETHASGVVQAVSTNVKIHRVALGETVVLIAKKYMVTPKDIYDLNPDAVNGISANQALKIPLDKSIPVDEPETEKRIAVIVPKPAAAEKPIERRPAPAIPVTAAPAAVEAKPFAAQHVVKAGETLTSLARKYGTTIEVITRANSRTLKRGLQAGQTITVPVSSNVGQEAENVAVSAAAIPAYEQAPEAATVEQQPKSNESPVVVTHIVQPGETLTGLARKYGTTIEAITAQNSKPLKRGLQAGQKLKISAQPTQELTAIEVVGASTNAENASDTVADEPQTVEHHVSAGETLTGLARKYNTSIEAITSQNSRTLKRGLQAGQTLRINSGSGHSNQ
jgi:LysM repeat protein